MLILRNSPLLCFIFAVQERWKGDRGIKGDYKTEVSLRNNERMYKY